MANSVRLLLVETVEHLGIVGDIVNVKPGYARNYLLPHGIAEFPNEERLAELQDERQRVQEELAALREQRQKTLERIADLEISIVRSTNDQGLLYGSVTQRDISDALEESGYDVDVRFIRTGQPFRRIGSYTVPIQFEKELRTEITVNVESDRPLEEREDEMEFDDEGNLIEKPRKQKALQEEQPAGDEAQQSEQPQEAG